MRSRVSSVAIIALSLGVIALVIFIARASGRAGDGNSSDGGGHHVDGGSDSGGDD